MKVCLSELFCSCIANNSEMKQIKKLLVCLLLLCFLIVILYGT